MAFYYINFEDGMLAAHWVRWWQSFYLPHKIGDPPRCVTSKHPVPPMKGEGAQMRALLFTMALESQFKAAMVSGRRLPEVQMFGKRQDGEHDPALMKIHYFYNVTINAVGMQSDGAPHLLVDFGYERLWTSVLTDPSVKSARPTGAAPPPLFPGSFLEKLRSLPVGQAAPPG
jgi:hypothetical protein